MDRRGARSDALLRHPLRWWLRFSLETSLLFGDLSLSVLDPPAGALEVAELHLLQAVEGVQAVGCRSIGHVFESTAVAGRCHPEVGTPSVVSPPP